MSDATDIERADVRSMSDARPHRIYILGCHMPCCGRKPKGLLPEAGEVFERECRGRRASNGKSGLHEPRKFTITLEPAEATMPNATFLRAVFKEVTS